MSTTDTRAAFERIVNAPLGRHSIYTDQYENTRTQELWSFWQAATEAAKDIATAGDLPPLPVPKDIAEHGMFRFNSDQMREYGQACAEAARHDKDGNHADDLRVWLDEARDEIEVQGTAFHATSLKLKAAEAELAARQPAPVTIKTWGERVAHHPDRIFAEFVDQAKDAEIADLRAALATRSQT